jgi:hypothetical protein
MTVILDVKVEITESILRGYPLGHPIQTKFKEDIH